MSLIYEYGDRREEEGRKDGKKEGIKETLLSFINSGFELSEISKITGKSIQELKEILNE